jgi:hypothetical protein
VFVSNRIANKLILRSFAYIVRTNCVGSTDRLGVEVRGNTTFCNTDPVNTILVAPTGTNIASYQWFFNGVRIANATNDRITAQDAGTYFVNLISRENCVSPSLPVVIRRFIASQVSIAASRDVLTATTQANAVSYEWFLNGNLMPNSFEPQISATQSGRYTVRITDRNGCRSSSDVYNHTLVSSEEEFFINGFKIYPNPTSGSLFLESSVEKITKIQVHDITGRQINAKIEQFQSQQFSIDISAFAAGTYFVEIQTDKGLRMKKIVKQ